jgi:hypothetical protein
MDWTRAAWPWPAPKLSDYLVPPPAAPTYLITAVPIGCICPPGANKECERPDCPRKCPKEATNNAG